MLRQCLLEATAVLLLCVSFVSAGSNQCKIRYEPGGPPVWDNQYQTTLDDRLWFYQTTICYLRCTDRATARVGDKDYHAQDVFVTLTELENGPFHFRPFADCTFPDLTLSTISPGDTVTIKHLITGSAFMGSNYGEIYSTVFEHKYVKPTKTSSPTTSPTVSVTPGTCPSCTTFWGFIRGLLFGGIAGALGTVVAGILCWSYYLRKYQAANFQHTLSRRHARALEALPNSEARREGYLQELPDSEERREGYRLLQGAESSYGSAPIYSSQEVDKVVA